MKRKTITLLDKRGKRAAQQGAKDETIAPRFWKPRPLPR